MWNVVLSPDVQKSLKKLDSQISLRLENGLKKLKTEEPFHFLEHYENSDYYKYRIGEYRALVDVDFANKLLKIQVLDHRSRIYIRNK